MSRYTAVAPGWEADFDAMVDYAQSKGWVDGSRVRAHVVWPEAD